MNGTFDIIGPISNISFIDRILPPTNMVAVRVSDKY